MDDLNNSKLTEEEGKKAGKKLVIKQRKDHGGEEAKIFDQDLNWRTADSYFPLDVAYQASCGSNLLFRLEIQEYDQGQTKPHHQSMASGGTGRGEDGDLKALFSHILANDERNAFLFTFDMTAASSFKLYLKKAIKDLIFAHEEVEESRSSDKKAQVQTDSPFRN